MERLTDSYPWLLAIWLIAAAVAAILIIAHALHHGGVTLT
jgi:hypothetical protein